MFTRSFILTSLFSAMALAQTAAPAAATGSQPSMFEMAVPFIGMIGIFYFLILRPQTKRQKEQATFLSTLKRGDEVITSGGILGKIDGLTEQFVTLEVDQGVKLRVLRTQVATSKLGSEPAAKTPAK